MQILDGRKTARLFEERIKNQVIELKEKYGRVPRLVVVLVGNNPASISYVTSKEKASKRVGIDGEILRLDEAITQEELLKIIDDLNKDDSVDGFIVQLPLPKHIDEQTIVNAVLPDKDVDGMTLISAGRLTNRHKGLVPATPKGIMMLLDHYGINVRGLHAVVVGRSNIVGSPMAKLLTNADATVTLTHRHTKDLAYFTKQADVLVVATGIVNLVTADMVKPGAIIVDVGINRVDNKIVGDVDFENVKELASYITPVPGGVGPMTINALIDNVIEAFLNKFEK